MQNPLLKYYEVREQIIEGAWAFISKPQFVSKVIRNCDGSEFSHVAKIVSKEVNGKVRWCVLDSNAPGVDLGLLSTLIMKCDSFQIMIPLVDPKRIQVSLEKMFERADNGIAYDFWNGFKELVNRKFKLREKGLALKIKLNDKKQICSRFVSADLIALEAVTFEYAILIEPFPQDGLRYRNIEKTNLLIK